VEKFYGSILSAPRAAKDQIEGIARALIVDVGRRLHLVSEKDYRENSHVYQFFQAEAQQGRGPGEVIVSPAKFAYNAFRTGNADDLGDIADGVAKFAFSSVLGMAARGRGLRTTSADSGAAAGPRGFEVVPVSPRKVSLPIARESQGIVKLTATFDNVPPSLWAKFPGSVPKPTGQFRLIYGRAYKAARRKADRLNQAINELFGYGPAKYDMHEIVPVKFGGSPTSLLNKKILPRQLHREVTNWFNNLQRLIEG
jgi:hypothetical protein